MCRWFRPVTGDFLALALYMNGELPETSPVELAESPDIIRFNEPSVRAWIESVRSSGTTSPDDLANAAEASIAQFAPGTTV